MKRVIRRSESISRPIVLPPARPATTPPAAGPAGDTLALSPAAALEKVYLGLRSAVAPHAAAFKAELAGAGDRAAQEAVYDRMATAVLPSIPTSVDETMGRATLTDFRQHNQALPDTDPRVRRAQAMVDRLAGPAPRFAYKVTVFRNEGMEAASVGGSQIIMTTGMLESLDTDTKLAGILAHELNHAEQRDVVATNVWDELALVDRRPVAKQIVQALARGLESKADAGGARRAHAHGLAPDGMVRWLLEAKTEAERRAQSREARRHPDAQDHPTDAERIAALRAQIAREKL